MAFQWAFGNRSVAPPDVVSAAEPEHVPYEPINLRGASTGRLHRSAILAYRNGRLAHDDQLGAKGKRNERVRIRGLHMGDSPAVRAMLGRCSRATPYKRFHGFTDGVAHASHALADANQDVYGAWSAGTCIGMASLAVTEEGFGDIGVLVEDRWQRRGAGSALVAALVTRAKQLHLPSLVADILADNYFIIPLLARVGGITTTFAYSGYRVHVGLGSPLTASAIRGNLPVQGDLQ